MIRSASGETSTLYKQYPRWPLLALDFMTSCIKMDPQARPTAEDLLRHNYFAHDKFPQKFLQALREKVLAEYSGNPLLRRYRADVLMASDRKEMRRSSHLDQPPRWKIHLAEANVKRKFSCETVDASNNSFTLPRNSNHRLGVRQEEVKKSPSVLQSINRNNYNQGSLPKTFMRRVDQDAETLITPLWLGGGNQKKKEYLKLKSDDFCLPNVPGGNSTFLN